MDGLSAELWMAVLAVAGVGVVCTMHICAVLLREVERVEAFRARVLELRTDYRRRVEELAARRGEGVEPDDGELGQVDIVPDARPPAKHAA